MAAIVDRHWHVRWDVASPWECPVAGSVGRRPSDRVDDLLSVPVDRDLKAPLGP